MWLVSPWTRCTIHWLGQTRSCGNYWQTVIAHGLCTRTAGEGPNITVLLGPAHNELEVMTELDQQTLMSEGRVEAIGSSL